MRIYLTSIGCKLNQSEVETLAREFARSGHCLVGEPELAELSVVNSCTVTHVAARKSRQLIRRLHRANPRAHIVVTGCYSEMSPESVQAIEGVALVVGNRGKEKLVQAVEKLWPEEEQGRRQGSISCEPGPWPSDRTRAFVKIQDGCDNRCTFCAITLARGQEWSRPHEEVLCEIRDRVAAGHKEVVLTGVNTGAYRSNESIDLAELVRLILQQTDLPRLRLSSIEPWDVHEELLALWEDDRLCRHLHLPLQSGCNETLLRMGRHYRASHYAALVEQARAGIPGLAVSTDVIVGFPGETEDEFDRSAAFTERMAFTRLHVFPYSPRPGTPAAAYSDQVPPQEKKRRAQCLQAIGDRANRSFRQRFLGGTLVTLWEVNRGDGEIMSGVTDNYLRVYATCEGERANTLTPARLIHLHADGLWGQIIS
jgi:threonylcarbamoyladenosine tRNA methylthiotransferase MtaB